MFDKTKEALEEVIEFSLEGLKGDLKTLLRNKLFHYDVLYEEFMKTFETCKIRILKELKNSTFDLNSSKDSELSTPTKKKERSLLYQMKNLISNKIKR